MNQIEIYLKNNTNYESNGDITLFPTSCTYKDSEQEVTLEHPLDDEGRWKFIDYENILSIEENGKKKLFRVYNVVKSLYNITAYARPPFYDLIDTILLDVRPTDKNGQEAMDIILKDTGFTGHSNISTINTSYFVRKNIVNSLVGDDENSFINRWGGEFYTENFDVYINDRIGSDNGLRVEFGYNLEEVEQDINIEEVVTRIIPIGFNGIMLEGDTPWIDSPLINKYTHPKSRVIEFSDVKVKEKEEDQEGFNTIEEARAELIKRCNKMFDKGIDKPLVNYKISMINIENSTAYEDVKKLVKANKGDTVTCYISHLDIDVKARVVDFEKDMLTGEYISIELGNVVNNFIKEQADIQQRVNSILNSEGRVKADMLNGTIDALQTQFKALKDIAQPQDILGMIFEDRVENSKTFGAMAIGTMGFMIANSYKPGTQDWDFRTFGTGAGFIADFITAGVLNANLIKAGILKSFNGASWINMEDGTFSYGNGALKFDGANLSMETTDGTHGTKMSDGTLEFKVTGEVVGGVVATRYSSNKLINGFNIANAKNGDYVDIGKTDSVDFRGGSTFTPILRISNTVHELLGNFKGIQLLENTRMKNGKILFFESSDNNNPHEVYNALGSFLTLMGDNGMMLGYKVGEEKVKVLEIAETPNAEGNQVFIYKPLSMYGNTIKFVSDIYTGNTGGRYYHPGWCGSIEKVAKRVSNLNVSYDSGWYAFSRGTNGAPCDYGTLLHLKWGGEDPTDCTQLCIEVNTGRLFTRSTINNGAYWSSWVEK